MKFFYSLKYKQSLNKALFILFILSSFYTKAQKATVAIPVGIGSPCGAGGSTKDSVKFFDYSASTNILTHRSICHPNLNAPGFSDNLATITFNPYDNLLYFTQIKATAGIYSSYTFRWSPTICPDVITYPFGLGAYKTFTNKFVAGVEFDPLTGLGYQINFVDSTGNPPISPDGPNNVGQYTSGAIVNGLPAISYYDASAKRLKYVQALDANGLEWGTPVSITATGTDAGLYTSLIIVNGNPAISYYDNTNGDLKFVRATDVNGVAWGTPVTVEATNNIGQYTSLIIVNGNPAISYYDVTNGDLKYIRSTNATGSTWPATGIVVVATNNIGQYNSLAVVNGNPAISYYDVTNGNLAYVRSSDVNGAVWSAPLAIETANDIGQYTSLVVVNGNPAVSYYDNTNGDLKYIRASDASGTTWGTGIILSATGNTGQYSSMAVVNGNPAISYYDVSNKFLRYIRAVDASGTSWGAEVSAEGAANEGQFSSLIVVNGKPSVCYYDAGGKDVRFVQSNDVNGSLWYSNSNIFKMELQQVNFATGTLGISEPINFGARYIYLQNGDVVMTPGGQFLGVFDNKYFTVNWKDYNTAIPLVATFIDTLKLGAGNNLVGLAYSDGKLVGSIQNSSSCSSSYKQIDILTGAQTNISYNAGTTLFVSADMTDITSGIGAAKRLVSATENPVGSKTYDVVYEVLLKNYGGTPVSNVQAYDTLNMINGVANVLSASITSITGPPGITKNAAYDGKTAGNFNLLTPGSTLSNIPGQNTITLQITCKISNIQPGIIYYNQAVITGTGIFGDNLRDSSTNGSNPDLNSNDKPDDIGESQQTPLLVSVAAVTPPCTSLTNVLYTQSFGTGTGLSTTIATPVAGTGATLPAGGTDYAGSTTAPLGTETYTITNNAINGDGAYFSSLKDHTGNTNGLMLLVNADANNSVLYRGSFNASLCPNQQYSLSFYAAFPGNAAYQTKCNAFGGFIYPKILMRIRDGITGLIITQVSTGDITNNVWQQFGLKFVSPGSYTSIIIELINNAAGGCGNDVALDDIQFGSCDALPSINVGSPSIGCLGGSTTFSSSLSDPSALPGTKDYQWQVSTDNVTWVDIAGAISSTYTINPVTALNVGKYYRVLVAATGNIASPTCRYASPGILLTAKTPSTPATSAKANKNNVCPGNPILLTLTGGTLGTNATWKWYSGSCGGTFIGTGTSITVNPTVATTYYVRAEGDCNITACVSVTITISCDIDKDKDGIPDFVESNIAAALADADGDGIINAYDTDYAGFVDNNGDFINDNFEADGDSNGDGILNYKDPTFLYNGLAWKDTNSDGINDYFDNDLDGIINMLDLDSDNDGIPDVVEAGGVDANGDGKIDNFTDTDNDGLSQNVDGNNSGAYNSGVGLGAVDIDGDGVLNEFDLDSDNDGIPDVVEAGAADINFDGKVDGFIDANTDGISDGYVGAGALIKTGADTNNDGRADSYPNKNMDGDKRTNPYDLDSDGDGIVDVIEAGFTDANYDGFIDGPRSADGWNTAKHGVALNLRNTDGRGNDDYLDIDADDDGIPDNIEGQSTAGYKFPTYLDSDNDGIDNAYDLAPFAATFGGSGIFVYDFDLDGTPDYRDLDTDGDGRPDIIEGNDFNRNGMSDDNVTLTLLDTDGDGLDNRFDSLNTGPRGTSYNMGAGGSTAGDATPGTRAPVQKTIATQPDRDWRYAGYVLDVQLLNFTANAQANNNVYLNWKVIANQPLNRFEIERSTDNRSFTIAGTLAGDIPLQVAKIFDINDDITGISSEVIYYRLKIISTDNQVKFSNVIMVKKGGRSQSTATIQPNPAANNVSILFYCSHENDAVIKMVDNLGKTVLIQKQKVYKGDNNVQLTGLSRFSDGTYSIQILMEDDVITRKLIIRNR